VIHIYISRLNSRQSSQAKYLHIVPDTTSQSPMSALRFKTERSVTTSEVVDSLKVTLRCTTPFLWCTVDQSIASRYPNICHYRPGNGGGNIIMTCMSFIVPHPSMICSSRSSIQILYIMISSVRHHRDTCTTTPKNTRVPSSYMQYFSHTVPSRIRSVGKNWHFYVFIFRSNSSLAALAGGFCWNTEMYLCRSKRTNLVYNTLKTWFV